MSKKEIVLTKIDENRRIIQGESRDEYIIITTNQRHKVSYVKDKVLGKQLYINGDLIEIPKESKTIFSSFDHVMKLDGLLFHFVTSFGSLEIVFNGEFMKNKEMRYFSIKKGLKEMVKALCLIPILILVAILKLPRPITMIILVIILILSACRIKKLYILEREAASENKI